MNQIPDLISSSTNWLPKVILAWHGQTQESHGAIFGKDIAIFPLNVHDTRSSSQRIVEQLELYFNFHPFYKP